MGPEPRRGWIQAEWDHYVLGPFDGHVPGLVRRVRRILDVSQRGLAALLDVSQSTVARWETGRTSPVAPTTVVGHPDDHPAIHQLAAEAEHQDERREEWRRRSATV